MGFIEFYAIAFLFYSLVWLGSVIGLAKSPKQALREKDVLLGTLVSLMGILVLSGLFLWYSFFPDGQYQDRGVGAGLVLTLFSLSASSVIMFMIAQALFPQMASRLTFANFSGIQFVAPLLLFAGVAIIA